MKKFLCLVCATFFLSFSAFALGTGEKAPEFSLKDVNGKNHTLSEYKGKFVVLEWFNPECPFVRKHYDTKNMQNLQKEFVGKGVIWLTINSSAKGKQGHLEPDTGKKVIAEKGLASTALLLDGDGKVGKMFDAKTTPHMFAIDPKGVIIYQGAIDNKPSINPADVQSADNYIRKSLREALEGKSISTASTSAYGCSIKYE